VLEEYVRHLTVEIKQESIAQYAINVSHEELKK